MLKMGIFDAILDVKTRIMFGSAETATRRYSRTKCAIAMLD